MALISSHLAANLIICMHATNIFTSKPTMVAKWFVVERLPATYILDIDCPFVAESSHQDMHANKLVFFVQRPGNEAETHGANGIRAAAAYGLNRIAATPQPCTT